MRHQGACPEAGSCSPFSLSKPATAGGAQIGPKAVSHLDLVSSVGPSGAFQLFLVKKKKIIWRMENSGKRIEMLLSFGKVNISKQGRCVNWCPPLWTGRRAVRSYNSKVKLSSCDLCGVVGGCHCVSGMPASLHRSPIAFVLCFVLLFSLQRWLWLTF